MASTDQHRVQEMMTAAADAAPPALAKYIKLASPVVAAIVQVAEIAWPYFWQAMQMAYATYLLLPTDAISAIVGLVFCFCGGLYPLLFAAVEAARQTGWAATVRNTNELVDQAKIIIAENKKDDDVDADGDGVKDVKQIDAKALLLRKTNLVLTKSDPQKINAALGGLYMTWLGVISVLKVQFAKTITMALAIADMVNKPTTVLLLPALEAVSPKEYHRWLPVLLGWGCKSIGISIAWYVQRVISAFTSATRGGLQTSRALLRLAEKHGLWKGSHEDTYLDEIVGWMLAAAGFYVQYQLNFAVPFPLNWVLWPFELSEAYIMWAVTSPPPA